MRASPTSLPFGATRRGLLLAGAASALLPWPARAQALPDAWRDTLVKAAFLHRFASFVEWPEGTFPRPDAPLRIAIVGDDLLWHDLSDLARDRKRDGHPVFVDRVAHGGALAGYHIIYVKSGSPNRIADLLATVPEGVLTVADSDAGTHPRGSVLSFFLDEGRVRFGVSLQAAARQKLRLHPRLIAAARQVGLGDADTALA